MTSLRRRVIGLGCAFVILGGALSAGGLWTFGGTIGIWGIIAFVAGMFMQEPDRFDPEEVASWRPSAAPMANAGRTMYRVDTTIDEPIHTTVLCGSCAHLAEMDGPRPATFTCPGCGLQLWEDEEE